MALGAAQDDAQTFHDLTAHETVLQLGTDHLTGLSGQEAERRLGVQGPNSLPAERGEGPVRRFARQLNSPLIYVLIASGIITLLLGEKVDSTVIFAVVLVNAVVGFVQESKAESALEALRSMVHTDATVIRDGVQRSIPSEEIVPGDLVLLEAGDRVPADLRLIEENQLRTDESALTGESLPVEKNHHLLAAGAVIADRVNMGYSGTLVTNGSGRGIAVATGTHTEIGKIHGLVGSADAVETPLTRKLSKFSMQLTILILGLAVLAFIVGVARGESASDMFVAVVALAVGAIPEGLPAAVAITLAIGVSRMAQRRAVIRRLPVVETLGSATVICSDKTGTLTENRMTVQGIWTADGTLAQIGDGVDSLGPDPTGAARCCLVVGANCNDAWLGEAGETLGDPTETAMLVVAQQHGVIPRGLERVAALPFSSERQYMATVHVDPSTGGQLLMVKGAVERVLEVSAWQMTASGTTEAIDPTAVHEAAEDLARQGMRVLATAVQRDPDDDVIDRLMAGDAGGMIFTGLQAMIDPPRSTAADAVASCHAAGLSVKMITGDHATTAAAIARRIGILPPSEDGGVLVGNELERIDDTDLPDAAERTSVFARVTPDQKLRLVRALQSRDHVVAMTGDGVNDAPALKQADIGVAMGVVGTEAAKDAADMVLTDDDFATIEAAVEEGRGVFDNLTKFIVWTLPTNLGEGLVILVAILLAAELPILPTQILWINMTTAVALGLTLAWEPKEPGIMERPPRNPHDPIVSRPMVVRTALVSALLLVGSWWVFRAEVDGGSSLEASRTAAVNVFVMVEAFYLFICRSLTRPSWRVGLLSNPYLVVGVTLQAIGQLALTYLPAMNTLFQTAPIGWDSWLRIVLVAIAMSLVVAIHKYLANGRRSGGQTV
ncbi:HAD-IC family P-type ATPase [Aeromicrobium wangtongii]|uniref:HAD-IC family P-type ATPase n=1 Tax=Aeromicrobium wangtongii TaxID=2969247 RepID=A0ABY5M4R4_9ACTN|nr:HAD-IC family P-type ATPase [Aeromicrobium wangtongii]MCD9197995.1 HAD-IC family P-type ATPase [Aeromicrobium wangtongii]UUP12039.1 HAD-IC family P-type ATPase [Aeromicrobium wangtongii]